MSFAPESPASILILLAHPYPDRSRVNRALLQAVADLPAIVVHDLYGCYPDFHIDVEREQALLRQARIIVFQHPMYWYSAPALLKQWQDEVLEHGFAYGSQANELNGKLLLSVVSTGHRKESYYDGEGRYTVEQLLRPFQQMARHCGMRYLDPFITYGARRLDAGGIAVQATAYRSRLLELRAGREDGTYGG